MAWLSVGLGFCLSVACASVENAAVYSVTKDLNGDASGVEKETSEVQKIVLTKPVKLSTLSPFSEQGTPNLYLKNYNFTTPASSFENGSHAENSKLISTRSVKEHISHHENLPVWEDHNLTKFSLKDASAEDKQREISTRPMTNHPSSHSAKLKPIDPTSKDHNFTHPVSEDQSASSEDQSASSEDQSASSDDQKPASMLIDEDHMHPAGTERIALPVAFSFSTTTVPRAIRGGNSVTLVRQMLPTVARSRPETAPYTIVPVLHREPAPTTTVEVEKQRVEEIEDDDDGGGGEEEDEEEEEEEVERGRESEEQEAEGDSGEPKLNILKFLEEYGPSEENAEELEEEQSNKEELTESPIGGHEKPNNDYRIAQEKEGWKKDQSLPWDKNEGNIGLKRAQDKYKTPRKEYNEQKRRRRIKSEKPRMSYEDGIDEHDEDRIKYDEHLGDQIKSKKLRHVEEEQVKNPKRRIKWPNKYRNKESADPSTEEESSHKPLVRPKKHQKTEDGFDKVLREPVKFAYSQDSVPSESGHQKHHEVKKVAGGGEEHHSDHHASSGKKGDKGYKSYHLYDKGKKGFADKEGHEKKYSDHKGKKAKHKDTGGHYGAHHHEHKGKKAADFAEKGEHKKGHSTKGEHNIHKMDEYVKKHEFYDEHHEGGEHEKHGGYKEKHDKKHGGKYKKGHKKGGYHDDHHGKKGHHEKGGHYDEHKGHKEAKGEDEKHGHKEAYGKKEGHKGGKKWGFKKKER